MLVSTLDTFGNNFSLDVVVFRLVGTNLLERVSVPWDQDGSGTIPGLDFVEQTILPSTLRRLASRGTQSLTGARPSDMVTLGITMSDGRVNTRTVKFLTGVGR